MATCVGFPPVAQKNAQVLILGSLPGAESLRQRRYYAKQQNSFWKIMGALVGAHPELPYQTRLKLLKASKIALWDVCAKAKRTGSLDSNIRSPKANALDAFLKAHKNIQLICFNGQGPKKLFDRYVKLKASQRAIDFCVLPSTSPAYAGLSAQDKLVQWRRALKNTIG